MDLTMMERVGDRWEKMEGYCSTDQSPQWAVVPVEEEDTINKELSLKTNTTHLATWNEERCRLRRNMSRSHAAYLPYLATPLFTCSFNCCGCGYVDRQDLWGRIVKVQTGHWTRSLSANDISRRALTSAAAKGHKIRGGCLVSCSEATEVGNVGLYKISMGQNILTAKP
jgi:hypothetical protein